MTGIALIGTGNWGGNWLRTLVRMPEVSLRWCCDLNENLLAKVREQFPSVPTTTSFDEVIRDPATQGVVIASIAPTHFPLAKRALEAGKHVMVEKPMTLTAEIPRMWRGRFARDLWAGCDKITAWRTKQPKPSPRWTYLSIPSCA